MADAGLNISTAALGLTFAVMLAANVAPTSAVWLWAFEPIEIAEWARLFNYTGFAWIYLVKDIHKRQFGPIRTRGKHFFFVIKM